MLVATHLSSCGYVSFLVSNIVYKYRVDKGLIDSIERLARYNSFKALNLTKKHSWLIERRII